MSDIDVHIAPTPRPSRRSAHRGRRALASIAALGLALTGVALNASSSSAEGSTISPDSGPIEGGTTVALPDDVTDLNFVSVHALDFGTIALTDEGDAYAWGYNYLSSLGFGNAVKLVKTPTRIPLPGGIKITQLSTGGLHVLALGSDGLAYGWGSNINAQMGNGSQGGSQSPKPVKVQDGVTFTAITTAISGAKAIDTNGHVWAWGTNRGGPLGDPTLSTQAYPVRVPLPEDLTFTQVAMSGTHGLALTNEGTAYSWGKAFKSGDWSFVPPHQVTMPEGVKITAVEGTVGGFIATGSDNKVYAWGNDDDGGGGKGGRVQVVIRLGAVTAGQWKC